MSRCFVTTRRPSSVLLRHASANWRWLYKNAIQISKLVSKLRKAYSIRETARTTKMILIPNIRIPRFFWLIKQIKLMDGSMKTELMSIISRQKKCKINSEELSGFDLISVKSNPPRNDSCHECTIVYFVSICRPIVQIAHYTPLQRRLSPKSLEQVSLLTQGAGAENEAP